MIIYIETLAGRKVELGIEASETVDSLIEVCRAQKGLSITDLDLVYSGKKLERGRTLSDYNVYEGATLHLAKRNSAQGSGLSVDLDEHLIAPDVYYDQLDIFEKLVIESSEFCLTKGIYDPTTSRFELTDAFKSFSCNPAIERHLMRIAKTPHEAYPVGGNRQAESILLSLGKSYLVLSHIIDNVHRLTLKGFCNLSYTMLIQRHTGEGDIAELVPISFEKALLPFRAAIANSITIFELKRYSGERVDGLSIGIEEILKSGCKQVMDYLSTPLEESLEKCDILLLCRSLVDLLDLGLVSYMGSHGSRFDLDYIGQDLSSKLTERTIDPRIGFVCSLRRLACLDEFLNHQQVWVFRLLWTSSGEIPSTNNLLAVLTSIQAFADTWGPIWQVSAGDEHPDHIRQLNVSTGLICRTLGGSDSAPEVVPCHWFDGSTDIALAAASSRESLISKSAKLLIGALEIPNLQSNETCPYKLDDLERDCGLQMTPLGTQESSWTLDARQVGFSAAHYVGISVAGTQKKLPRTTLKQAIWNKWRNQPKWANPQILNSRLGVEISHCTGNARRIRLLDLFILRPIQDLLARQFPNWLSTCFGPDLKTAFSSGIIKSFLNVWVNYYESREQISDIICCVLELLEKTGTRGGKFHAAVLNGERELSMPFDIRLNSWADLLEDSHLTAIYAIVNEKCLNGCELGYPIANCNSSSTPTPVFTVFETQIAIPREHIAHDKIWLDQRGCLLKLQPSSPASSGLQLVTWESGRVRELGDRLGRLFGSRQAEMRSREVQDEHELGGQHVPVLVKASVASYGGLSVKRTRQLDHLVGTSDQQESLPIRAPEVDLGEGDVEVVGQPLVQGHS